MARFGCQTRTNIFFTLLEHFFLDLEHFVVNNKLFYVVCDKRCPHEG